MKKLLIAALVLSSQWSWAAQKNLVYGEVGKVDRFDPYTAQEVSADRLSDLIFDRLVDLNDSGEYAPNLAQSWEISKGKTELTLTLRKDVKWHDGKSFSADDVAATIATLKNPKSEIPNRDRFEAIKSAEKISGNQVRISFVRALADPLRVLLFKIVPAHALNDKVLKRDSAFCVKPIGTGPYKFTSANGQGEVQLTANAQYFKGKPKVEQVLMKPFMDPNIMAQSLMFNALDLVTSVSPRDLQEVAGDKRLTLVPYDALSYSFIAFNTSRGVLKEKRVRQALALGINRQEMLTSLFQSRGQLITGPFPPSSWAYNIDVPQMNYDLQRAKGLLRDAGLEDRDGDGWIENDKKQPLAIEFLVPANGNDETARKIAISIQSYLQKVGVKLQLKFVDWMIWKQKVLGEHDYEMTTASWSFDDATNITSLFHSSSAKSWGNNFVMYQNPDVDALLTESQVTNDGEKKRLIYHKLHAQLADESPYVFLWNLQHNAAHRSTVKSVKVDSSEFFKYVRLWDIERNLEESNSERSSD